LISRPESPDLDRDLRLRALIPYTTWRDTIARAAARFVDTMVEAKPAALCRAFGWSRERAAAALES
jgi:hypothetical protein